MLKQQRSGTKFVKPWVRCLVNIRKGQECPKLSNPLVQATVRCWWCVDSMAGHQGRTSSGNGEIWYQPVADWWFLNILMLLMFIFRNEMVIPIQLRNNVKHIFGWGKTSYCDWLLVHIRGCHRRLFIRLFLAYRYLQSFFSLREQTITCNLVPRLCKYILLFIRSYIIVIIIIYIVM